MEISPSASVSTEPVTHPSRPIFLVTAAWVIFCLAYAIFRYCIFGAVPIENLPLFVANKGVAVSALGLFGAALCWPRGHTSRHFARIGMELLALHAVVSMLIVNPAYFLDWFDTRGRFVGRIEFSMLLGGIGLLVLVWVSRRIPTQINLRWVAGALVLAGVHAGLVGWPTWFAPESWPGGMPPITLFSAILGVVAPAYWAMK